MTPHLVLKKLCKILNTDVLQLSWIFSGYGDKGGDLQGVVFPLDLWVSSPWLSCLPYQLEHSLPTIAGTTQNLIFTASCKWLQISVSHTLFSTSGFRVSLIKQKNNLSIYLVKKFCISPPYVVVGHVMNRNTFQFVLKSDSGNTCSYLPFSRQNSSGKMSWKCHENPSKTLNMMPIIIPEKNRYAPIIPENKHSMFK